MKYFMLTDLEVLRFSETKKVNGETFWTLAQFSQAASQIFI